MRPDLFVLDDIETSKTKESYPITKKIIDHITEMKAGLSSHGNILYIGNYITEEGVIEYIRKSLLNRGNAVYRNVPVESRGVIAWPGKYAATDAQTVILNRGTTDRKRHKVSLEAKKRELGETVYQVEMMNNPAKSGDLIFDRRAIEDKLLGAIAPIKDIAGLRLWAEFNAKHRYAAGGDTAEGVGLDSSAMVLIDFSRIPALVVATYESNQVDPTVFAHEMKRAGEMFGMCLLAPEVNDTGFATIAELTAIYDDDKIYRRQDKNKVDKKVSQEFGWRTTGGNKTEIIYQLKSAIEDGQLEVLDEGLLLEMKYYSKKDLRAMKHEEGMTRHFDKFIACAIAWEMRHHALAPKETKIFQQKTLTPSSIYEG